MRFWLVLVLFGLVAETAAVGKPLRSGVDRRAINTSVRPQDDLFQYVNGEWLKHTPIPADKSNYGTFGILADEAQLHIRAIITEAMESKSPRGSDAQKVGDFFLSYMDEATIDQRGLGPLVDALAKIEKLRTKEEVVEHFGALQAFDVTTPIGFYVDLDDKNSAQHLAVVTQSGTSLPDRDYYLKDEAKYLSARAALKTYIVQLFELGHLLCGEKGLPDGESEAVEILALETKLAAAKWTRTELRDADKRYNKFRVNQLPELAPDLAWEAFFEAALVPQIVELNVSTPSFFVELAKIVEETPVEVWKQYLRFHLLSAYASALPAAFVDARFELYGKELSGLAEQKPRWKRAVRTVGGGRGFGVLGDAIGRIYVEKHFSPEAREQVKRLVDNLMLAYESSIHDLTWMTAETKVRALEKLAKITIKIGYTEKWRDYSSLVIEPDDLLGNLKRSAEVEYRRMIDQLGEPVDRAEWHMTPQTVNAYYNSSMNEIVFPAAILQPPFFDLEADDAVNYGSIGSVIGHEISHAFDDQGSKYDGDGNLRDWWTTKDRVAFKKLTRRLVAQYSEYSPLEGKRVNGELTLGENIADLSGMSIAFKAYQLSLDGSEPPVLEGWTGPQRFFLGWGQSWRRKYRDAEMVNRLLTDPHSPAEYRGNGPLMNFAPFYEAFDLKEGDALYRAPEQRIRIW